jgi:hypothetical protein
MGTSSAREDRVVKLIRVVATPSATAGEKANACDVLARLYREDEGLAGVGVALDTGDDEGEPWYASVSMADVQGAVYQAEQLADIVGDWIDRRRERRGGE